MTLRLLTKLVTLAALCTVPAVASSASSNRCTTSAAGEDSFCEVDGVKLHLVDWGGDGPPLIMLSGLGDSARIFDDIAPQLSRSSHVYAFTRRGFGPSQAADDYSSAALVQDILSLMDGLGIQSADFVGHSVAGGELSQIAANHPQRVRRIVYLDAAYDRSAVFELGRKIRSPAGRQPMP